MKKTVSMLFALSLCLSLTVPAFATDVPEPSAVEHTFSSLLPDNAQNIYYAENGNIFFKDGDTSKFIDGQTGEVYVVLVEYRVLTRAASVNHTPANIGSNWVFIRTDGPYETKINWFALMKALEGVADWTSVLAGLGIPAALIGYICGQIEGGFVVDAYWRIDDGYHAVYDYTMFHVESYWYSDAACTNQIGHDSHEWHG